MSTITESDSTCDKAFYGGVDTHKDLHVAALLDELGRVVGTSSFPATSNGYAALLFWMKSFGTVAKIGVEGTGSWGAGLARYLKSQNVEMAEVNRTNRQVRRLKGKSDETDAIAAARQVLSGEATAVPRDKDGIVESIRVLRVARRSAMQSRTQAANQIHSLIDSCPEDLRKSFKGLGMKGVCLRARAFRVKGGLDDPLFATKRALRGLARRWLALTDELESLDGDLEELVTKTAPPALLDECGVGIDVAGALIVAFGENTDRLNSDAAFSALCGVSPLDASSGRQQRHRLNRGGDRQANNALWRIVIVRLAHHQPTKDYMERRLKEGKSKKEVIRCLKRYLARHIFLT